jgi:hypothetical protein
MTQAFEWDPDAAPYPANAPMLRLALRILGWSQAEFARRLGVHESTASRIVNGRAALTADNVGRLLAIVPGLRVEEVVLLPGVSPEPPAGARDTLPVHGGVGEGPGHAGDGKGTQVGGFAAVDLVHGSDAPPPA